MKFNSKSIALILAFGLHYVANAQKLSLVGSNFSFAKGNIDVEVVTQIIEAKQDEVLEKVFRDLIIDNLKDQKKGQKSFATYSYIYNLSQTITLEKNKTVITRQVVNNVFEYCLVYGFTRQFLAKNTTSNALLSASSSFTGPMLVAELETLPTELESTSALFLKDLNGNEWKSFNIYLDMAYDIFLNDAAMHDRGLFKLLDEQPTLKQWYERDNAYLAVKADPAIIQIRANMEAEFSKIKAGTAVAGLEDIANIYNGLDQTDFKQETISEAQYKAVKSTLRLAIKALKTYSDNNLIANISSFLLDYTLIEFAPAPATDGLGTQTTNPTKRGILYIDVEGLVSALYDKYANNNKRSTVARAWGPIIPRPFLVIGATHSGAISNNNQLLVKDGQVANLNNIYFAGEKLGLKFTAFDRKYTHSFEPGEEFKYRGRKTYWIEPQKQPTISRAELYLYGSGLLYNLVDIKSQENFNYTLAGASVGVTFFNGLMLNTGLALPVNATGNLSNKYLYTLSFDIPIIEYLTAVRKKRKG